MTIDYHPGIRRNICDVFKEYFDFLGYDFEYKKQQKRQLREMPASIKRDPGIKIRDHTAKGRHHLCHIDPARCDWEKTIIKTVYIKGKIQKSGIIQKNNHI